MIRVFISLSILSACQVENRDKEQTNILFIIIDDQNEMITPFGFDVKTPNIQRLANRSTLFTRAYCTAPACGPSRASFLSGMLPSSTGVYYNSQPEAGSVLTKARTLPETFLKEGFITGMYGKIFHEDNAHEKHQRMCTEGFFSPHRGFWANIPDSMITMTDFRYEGGSNFAWAAVPDDWENNQQKLIDTENADKVIQVLQEKYEKPFFISLGFLRPHLPWIVPQRFFDMFPLEDIDLTDGYLENDIKDLPECAKWMAKEVPGSNLGESTLQDVITEKDKWKEALQAYMAASAYTDYQVGRILDAVESGPNASNTIIVLCTDHGYHHGEKDHWTKFGLWEQSNRVPFMISLPGQKKQICQSPVSLLDIYPTLLSLANLDNPETHKLEGVDLTPLIENPTGERGRPVLSTYGFQCHTLRDERWRYIRYRNGDEELYDHKVDPHEWNNLASNSAYNSIMEKMKAQLPEVNVQETNTGSNLGWDPMVFKKGYVYEGAD